VANDLGRCRGLAAKRPAELTDDAIGAPVEMNVLAGQRGAPAISAAMPVGLEGTDTATQQDALELLNVTRGEGHDQKDSSSRARLLPVCNGQATGKDPGQASLGTRRM
jgi:hypothetical protein